MPTLTPSRDEIIDRLRREEFDLLVVGGGITGAGTALDAATRGLRVALVERDDYASGTSSKSSKLVHGGLRYLAHLEVGLVREALTERGVLQRMAGFLVSPTPFVIPRYGKRRHLALRAGLDAYDVLAIGSGFPRHRKVDAPDVLRMAPALRSDAAGGLVYWDARTDDARLTWTVLRTAIEHGAVAANHAEVVELLRSGPEIRGRGRTGRVVAAAVADRETGETFEVRARAVVNASGVWADELRRMEDVDGLAGIRPSKGIHIVLSSEAVDVSAALLVPAPDARYIFVIPWDADRVLVGTTDEDYSGPIDAPRAEPDEIDYLIDTLNRVLERPVSAEDVVASYAGLRPLIQRPGQASKDLSRRHRVLVGSGGVVTMTGGKLTTYRRMSSDAVDAALESGEFPARPASRTSEVHLAGGLDPPGIEEALGAQAVAVGLDPAAATHLHRRYGSRAREVLDLIAAEADLAEPLHAELPYLRAEAAYAIATEAALRADDVLGRRLRARILSRDRGLAALDWVARRLASVRGWTTDRLDCEIAAYRAGVERDLGAERGTITDGGPSPSTR